MSQNKQQDTDKPFVSKIYKVKGEDRWLVQSASNPRDYHTVTRAECNCKGFQYRKQCRHINELNQKLERDRAEAVKVKVKLVYEP